MAGSKFVEILDTTSTPYSRDNVSLEDVLAETRERSESQGSLTSTSSEKSGSTSPTTSSYNIIPTEPLKTRLRGFSIRNKR
ncbi:hypothetical protein Slin15195_G100370 [Septoria linicola]|uniref:Uncharacterized protein n=1 Tax=Septoria linicola TaxID=215465 RepID=A0A9Q9EPN7_9PEZI|nr:hypothetical protein Slin14017_G063400 [Septoria linicola]USW56718.1 hypothetical protein Slin15195_G100370 [Septoria linicola]